MKISEIYSAMGLKIKLNYEDASADFDMYPVFWTPLKI